jgi:hypothetical protein
MKRLHYRFAYFVSFKYLVVMGNPIIVISSPLASFIYFGNNKIIKSLAAGCCRRLDLLLD